MAAEAAIGVAVYEGVETAAQAGVAAYYLTKPTLPLKAKLEHIASSSSIRRSHHTLSVISDRAYIFGGEKSSGQLAENDVHELHIPTDEHTTAVLRTIPPTGQSKDDVPSARIGHTAAVARDRIFIFGGRRAKNTDTLEENGRLWIFDPIESKWDFLDPPPNTKYPPARSFHASAASPEGNAIFIHAGTGSDGEDLDDVWVFYLEEGKWTRLPSAPRPFRNSPSLACGQGKLWRFGGQHGLYKLGGGLDYLEYPPGGTIEDPSEDVQDDSKYHWETFAFHPDDDSTSVTEALPCSRSSAALHFISTGVGRDYLLLALGHGGKAKDERAYLADVWAYQLPTKSYTGAGVKDSIRDKLPAVKSHIGEWAKVDISSIEVGEEEEKGGSWTGRGYFGTSLTGTKQFMVWGGVNVQDETLSDGWRVIVE